MTQPGNDVTSVFSAGLVGAETAPESAEAPLAEMTGLAPGTTLLVVKRGPNAGTRYDLVGDVVTAGRHPDSDIFLDDVSVSRRHAEFRRSATGYDVVDVGSLNGTYVNRESVDSSPLVSGDEVQIGKFRLVYLAGPLSRSAGEGAADPTRR